ncbi:hypothetical protein [Altericista sp. CCNU0014]|uniref:hypothetical protein n=1 Tax=Altericista sp. CCNU0014 TaxID=3082949 RepID=UPI00384EF753
MGLLKQPLNCKLQTFVVDGLDLAIVVAVACDEALEVGGFVEEGGEEVVVAVGGTVRGSAVGGVG